MTSGKDFYAVYNLLKNHPVDHEILEQAIRQTFERRGTPAPDGHGLFKTAFYQNEERNTFWKAWKRKAKLDMELEFSEVVGMIVGKLKPIYDGLS